MSGVRFVLSPDHPPPPQVGMECRQDLLPLMQPMIDTVLRSQAVFERDVARLLLNDFHFVAAVCPGDADPDAAFALVRAAHPCMRALMLKACSRPYYSASVKLMT